MNDQAIKSDANKPRLTLVPMQILYDIAAIREYGIAKYGDTESWRRVEPWRYRDALARHIIEYIRDPDSRDSESGLPHLHHAACNLAFLAELERERHV